MRKVTVALVILLFFTVIRSSSCSDRSISGELELTIEETQVRTLISLEIVPNGEYKNFYVIVPFPIDEKLASFPSEFLCSFEVIENRYSVFSCFVPAHVSYIEILGKSPIGNLVTLSDDWQLIQIFFSYEEAPPLIATLLNSTNTVSKFESVKVTFPTFLDMRQVVETPTASSVTDRTRSYEMSEILTMTRGKLTIKYPTTGLFWLYEMVFSAIFALIPSIGLVLKVQPRRDTRKRFLYLVPLSCVFFWTAFSTVMFYANGPTWDYLSKHYGGTLVITIAMSTWLRNIFGREPTEASVEE